MDLEHPTTDTALIAAAVDHADTGRLLDALKGLHPADIADRIEPLDEERKRRVFALLDPETAADVLVELNDPSREEILEETGPTRLAEIAEEMESDEAADLIAELPEETAAQVLRMMGREEVAEITELMAYGPETAGGIMQRELLAVREDATVAQAVEAFQKLAREEDVEDIHNVFVTDRDHRLVGVLPVRRLLLVDASTPIKRVMNPDAVRVRTDVDQEEVAGLFKKYNLLSMPVVDGADRLVGRITVDDIVDVIAEESGEDILLLGGVHDEDRVFCSPGQSVRKRLPWLAINLGTALLAAGVVSLFEGTLSRAVRLAVFMPVVAGMGGNAGTQTLTLITRGIALGELSFANAWRALMKECLVALVNGAAIGLVMAIGTYAWKGDWMLGVVLGLALIINMFVAGAVGTVIPVLLKRIGVDPAVASGIIVTTFTDCCGFFSFLGLATLALRHFHI